MKKQHIIYLIAGIAALVLIAGGWYAYKFRKCAEKVSYVPPREQGVWVNTGSRFTSGPAEDKGDYYILGNYELRKFKISDDAMRACIWK